MNDINRQEICATALDKIYPRIYELDNFAGHILETFFPIREENFNEDENAQRHFTYSYETISTLVSIMRDIIFEVRLCSEYALGFETDIIRRNIELNQEKVSWLEKEAFADD